MTLRPGTSTDLGLVLRSALFTLGLAVSTVVWAPLSLLTFALPYGARYGFITQWTRFNLWWLKKTCRLGFKVQGLDNMPPAPGIVLSKHQSTFETLALQLVFRPQVWVLKRQLLWIPFFGWGLAMLRPIAIDRSAGRRVVRRLVEEGRARLEQGCWVVIFPEGTRVAPGMRRRYLPGGALLAQQTGYPVVPVAHNAGEFWPRRGFIKRPGTVSLVVGPAIDSRGRSAAELNRLAEAWIEGEVGRINARPRASLVGTPRAARASSVENTPGIH